MGEAKGHWQFPGDTAANTETANPVLKSREIWLETDTGRMKQGDGINAYNALRYLQATYKFPSITGNETSKSKHGDALLEFIGSGATQKYTLQAGANLPPVESIVVICQVGSAPVEVVGSGMTIHPTPTPKTTGPWAHLAIRIRSATDAVVTGEFQ